VNYPPQGLPPQGPPPGDYGPPQGNPEQWGPPQPQPPWPQHQWSPGPPPKKRNGWKWALGGVALLAVIGVTAAVTISVTTGNDGEGSAPPKDTYGLASADDTAPVGIITEDPSCAAWKPIIETFGDTQRKGWDNRDPSVPATQWTPEQRAEYEEVRKAAIAAAEQTEPLVRLTPHRVMREFYEQFIAYSRAYSEAVPNYQPEDERLARVMTNTSAVLVYACDAIDFKSAAARSPLIQSAPMPTKVAPLTNPEDPTRFMPEPDPVCADWQELLENFSRDTDAWQELDSNTPASRWTPEQQQIIDATIPVFNDFADQALEIAERTPNPVLADFITFSAQYRRAYAAALPSYTPADLYLARTGYTAAATIYNACKAPQG